MYQGPLFFPFSKIDDAGGYKEMSSILGRDGAGGGGGEGGGRLGLKTGNVTGFPFVYILLPSSFLPQFQSRRNLGTFFPAGHCLLELTLSAYVHVPEL